MKMSRITSVIIFAVCLVVSALGELRGDCYDSRNRKHQHGNTWLETKTYGYLQYTCSHGYGRPTGCASFNSPRKVVGHGGEFCANNDYMYRCELVNGGWGMQPVTPYKKCGDSATSTTGNCRDNRNGLRKHGDTWLVDFTYGFFKYRCENGNARLLGCTSYDNTNAVVGNGQTFCGSNGFVYRCEVSGSSFGMQPVPPTRRC